MQFYAELCPLADYETLEAERLQSDELEEQQLFHLIMRCEGRGPDALRAPVFVRKLAHFLGQTSLQVVYTNRDLQPVTKGLASKLADDYWKPRTPMPLKSNRINAVSRIGYFVPYHTKLDDAFWVMANEMSLPPTF